MKIVAFTLPIMIRKFSMSLASSVSYDGGGRKQKPKHKSNNPPVSLSGTGEVEWVGYTRSTDSLEIVSHCFFLFCLNQKGSS